MSHVDDGTLHAYLDGELEVVQPGATAALEAHIAACGACRARLEEERRIRERAQAVLDHAAPAGLEVPPFDAVVERARRNVGGGTAPAAQPRRSLTLPLAWAASIALALAGGWWAHEMARAPEHAAFQLEMLEATAADDAEIPPVPAPATPASYTEDAARSTAPAGAAAKPSVAAQAELARAPAPAVEAGQGRMTDDATTAPAMRQRDEVVHQYLLPREPSAAVGAIAPLRAADSGSVVVVAESRVVSADAVRPERTAPARDSVQWSAVDRAEAERRLGGRLLVIEGLPVESIELADSAGIPRVRTRQRVAPGVAVVLLQHAAPRDIASEAAAGVARPSSPPAPERAAQPKATATHVVERSGFLVRLSADLPPDSLRALAARLR